MQHVLVQQLEKGAELLAVVKERILTTNSCSVTQTKKEQCTFQGVLGLAGMLGSSVQVRARWRRTLMSHLLHWDVSQLPTPNLSNLSSVCTK